MNALPEFRDWPAGTVATTAFFEARGVTRRQLAEFCARGELVLMGPGAFVRPGEDVGWPGAVFGLQQDVGRDVHPGGLSALQLHGLAASPVFDTAAVDAITIDLYGPPGLRLPVWFKERDWHASLNFLGIGLFAQEPTFAQHAFGGFSLRVSTPEQAILEILDGVPTRPSFEQAQTLMQNLTALEPARMQALLETCTSVKVKRLCLYLADTLEMPWFSHLDENRIDLGTGKRQIVPDGRLEKRWLITVPKE